MFGVVGRIVVVFVALGVAGSAPALVGGSSVPSAPPLLFAYVDPGAAGFVIVTILGFLAAVGYTIRYRFAQLERRVRKLFGRDAPEGGDGEEADPPAAARDAEG